MRTVIYGQCDKNPMIECSEYNRCPACGWNPEVEAERKRKLRAERLVKKEEAKKC